MKADLVLEGGGVKGIALVGAVSVLEERGYRFERVAGTSAGAIVGALVAAGMPAAEMVEVMRDLDYRRFRDGDLLDRLGLLGKAASVLFDNGIYEGRYLRSWLAERLGERQVDTFADLARRDPGASLPPGTDFRLVVMASDVTHGCLRRLPWDYPRYGLDPEAVPVADAVRASMSIPFFYEPVKLEGAGGPDDAAWLVDGGMLSNFPVDVFDRNDGQDPRWPTFGIKLSAKPEAGLPAGQPVRGPLSLALAMVATLTNFYDRIHLDDEAVLARTIFVDTSGVKATDFDLDEATQDRLYEAGRRAATRFLDGTEDCPAWDFEAYVAKYRRGAAPR